MSEIEETPKSSEELKKLQEQKDQFYDENLPFLRKMAEYERLNYEIAHHRLNRKIVAIKDAELSPPPEQPTQTEKK